MVDQRWWHSGGNGWRRKRAVHGEGRSVSRPHEAVAEAGGNGGRGGGQERWQSRGQTRWWPRSERDQHDFAVVRTVWVMGGPMWFYIVLNYPNQLKLRN
jgi:hypothetical protein